MDTIEFRFNDYVIAGYNGKTLEIYVNGQNLASVISGVEMASAIAEKKPQIAGAYQGLHLNQLDMIEPGHFLGAPGSHLECGPDDKTVLLACSGCGEAGCWPLMARVVIASETVSWTDFEQPHRETWDYAGFTLVFDRRQYDDALRDVSNRPTR